MLRSVFASRRVGATVFGLLTAGSAVAQAPDTLDQNAWLRVGAFQPTIDTTARVDSAGGTAIGSTLDLEGLGLTRKKTLATVMLGARLGHAWRAEFEYFRLSRQGSSTLTAQVRVDDTVYDALARVDSRFVSDVYRLSGGYSFVKTPQVELGAVLGLHFTRFDIGLTGTGTVSGQPPARVSEQRTQSVPLPTLGFYGSFAFAPGWQLTGRADYFSLRRGGVDGRLINAQAILLYRFTRQVAIGGGWRLDDYEVTSNRSAFSGRLEYRFAGPQVFLEAAF